jgi:hypothetical protein
MQNKYILCILCYVHIYVFIYLYIHVCMLLTLYLVILYFMGKLLFPFLLLCWGYTVAFTKVLTIY